MGALYDVFIFISLPFRILYYGLKSIIFALIPFSLRTKKVIVGDIALITGGGSGIGRALAFELARAGARVVIWDNHAGRLDEVRQAMSEQGLSALTFECDCSSKQSVRKYAALVKREVGVVTILINNAGIINGKYLVDLEDEEIEKVYNINILAHFWTIKAFLPEMMDLRKGHIVQVSSMAGIGGICKMSDYSSSKAAVNILSETLRLELLALGYPEIKVTLICPYLTNTGLFSGAQSRFPFLFPVLEPNYVARMILNAILLDKRMLFLPPVMRMLVAVYRLLPNEIKEGKEDLFGAFSAMEKFTGRQKSVMTNT